MKYQITIDLECTSDTMADVITLLELQLPYMADNVMVCSTLVEDDPDEELNEVPDKFFSDNKPNKVDTYVKPLSEELLTRWAAQINNES